MPDTQSAGGDGSQMKTYLSRLLRVTTASRLVSSTHVVVC